MKNSQNNGTEDFRLVSPTPALSQLTIGENVIKRPDLLDLVVLVRISGWQYRTNFEP